MLRRELWWVSKAVTFSSLKKERTGKEANICWNVGSLIPSWSWRKELWRTLLLGLFQSGSLTRCCWRAVTFTIWKPYQYQHIYPVCSTLCAASLSSRLVAGIFWYLLHSIVQNEHLGWMLCPNTLLSGSEDWEPRVFHALASDLLVLLSHVISAFKKSSFLPAEKQKTTCSSHSADSLTWLYKEGNQLIPLKALFSYQIINYCCCVMKSHCNQDSNAQLCCFY